MRAADNHQNTQECINSALFLHSAWAPLLILGPITLAMISILTTASLQIMVTPKASSAAQPANETNTGDIESTSIPLSNTSLGTEGQEAEFDQPPPYQPAEPTTPPQTAAEKKQARKSSAHAFVRGTALLFIPMVVSLFLLALFVQFIIYCNVWSPAPHWVRAFFWTIYAIICTYATNGLLSWCVLLRNLWGPAVAKKYPIKVNVISSFIFKAVITPPALILTIISQGLSIAFRGITTGAVMAIEACQRGCCGVDTDDQDEREWTELEEGRALVANILEEESSGSVSTPDATTKPLS